MKKQLDLAILLLRIATAANFLSAVASRFGLWKHVPFREAWAGFLTYTGEVNSFAPASLIPFLAASATTLEILIAILLLIGYKTRWAALAAAILTFIFAAAMTYSFGIKAPLDYAVFVDFTSAFLLSLMPRYRWSVDELLAKQNS